MILFFTRQRFKYFVNIFITIKMWNVCVAEMKCLFFRSKLWICFIPRKLCKYHYKFRWNVWLKWRPESITTFGFNRRMLSINLLRWGKAVWPFWIPEKKSTAFFFFFPLYIIFTKSYCSKYIWKENRRPFKGESNPLKYK